MTTEQTDTTEPTTPNEETPKTDQPIEATADAPAQDTPAPAEEASEPKRESVDIFHWANQADGAKEHLDIDLFLFTKGYTVYSTQYDEQLKQQLKVLFLYDMISGVQTGAATGLVVRDFEDAESEDNVLMRTDLEKVEHAQEVIEQIKYDEANLEVFAEGDHEFKKIKGMVARFTPRAGEPYYAVKLLPQTQVLKGATAWMFTGSSFQPFSADAGLRVTPDNQVLITGQDIFVFSESKFERLFGYSAKKFAIAEEKIREIEQHFKLKFEEGMSLNTMIRDKKALINKLQKVDPTLVQQDKMMDYNDEMDLGLMTDEATNSIIIMDTNDAGKFINLLNDDYVTSELTGNRYEIKTKKPLNDDKESDGAPSLEQLANR